jgi:hypothetical protein
MIFLPRNTAIFSIFAALILTVGAQMTHAQEGLAPTHSITCPTPLHFGMVVTCPAGGAVSVPLQGSARTTGCVIVSPGTSHAGQCRVDQPGGLNEQLQVAVLGPTVLQGEAGQMQVDQFVLHSASGQSSSAGDFLIISESHSAIKVGGRLNIGPGQANGVYSGAVTLTVITE